MLLLALSCIPLWDAYILPFSDIPNHIARNAVIANPETYTGIYRLEWEPAPYMAMDAVLQLLHPLFSLPDAMRIFVALCFSLQVAAVLTLSKRLHGRIHSATLLLYPALYNMSLLYGFANFLFGIPIALFSFAYWLWMRDTQHRWRWIGLWLILLANYFSHAISFGILLGAIGLYELLAHDIRTKTERIALLKTTGKISLGLIVPLLCWMQVSKGVAELGMQFGEAYYIIEGVFSPLLFVQYWPDAGIIACLIMLFALGTLRLPKTQCGFNAQHLWHWFFAISLIVSAFMLVRMFGIAYTHIRLPVFLYFLLVALLGWHWPETRIKQFASICLIGIFCILATLRYGDIRQNVLTCDGLAQQMEHAFSAIPASDAGAALFTIGNYENSPCPHPFANAHMHTLATMYGQLYVEELFTVIAPVKPDRTPKQEQQGTDGSTSPQRPLPAQLLRTTLPDAKAPLWSHIRNDFGYFLWLHYGDTARTSPLPHWLEPVAMHADITLYRNKSAIPLSPSARDIYEIKP